MSFAFASERLANIRQHAQPVGTQSAAGMSGLIGALSRGNHQRLE